MVCSLAEKRRSRIRPPRRKSWTLPRRKHETYAKLKEKLQHDHDTLKALAAPKDAKQFVEKLDEAT